MQLKVALPSLSTEELFRFPTLDSRQKVFCWYIQTNSVLEGVSPSLHKVSSLPGNRFLYYGRAALKCTESAGCKLPGEIAMVWGLASLGHFVHVRGILLLCFQFTFTDTFL